MRAHTRQRSLRMQGKLQFPSKHEKAPAFECQLPGRDVGSAPKPPPGSAKARAQGSPWRWQLDTVTGGLRQGHMRIAKRGMDKYSCVCIDGQHNLRRTRYSDA